MLVVFLLDVGIALGLLALAGIVRPIRRLDLATRRRALGLLAIAASIGGPLR